MTPTVVPPAFPALAPPGDELDHDRYEIIDGVRRELPPMSAESSVLAARLARRLSNHGIERDVGEAYPEVLFRLPLPVDRNRRPDVAFVPYARWAKDRPIPATTAWDVLPDLCVEVVSPHDLAEEIETKLDEYLRAGVRLVWVVYPRPQKVYVYDTPAGVRRLGRDEMLDGGAVLPDFRLPLAELFLPPPNPDPHPPS